jgi:hypothetical protein
MGFKDLGADLDNPAGYSEFLTTPLTGHEFQSNPSKSIRLLSLFKKGSIGRHTSIVSEADKRSASQLKMLVEQ